MFSSHYHGLTQPPQTIREQVLLCSQLQTSHHTSKLSFMRQDGRGVCLANDSVCLLKPYAVAMPSVVYSAL